LSVRTVIRACGYLKDELDCHKRFPTWLDSVFGSLHHEVNHPEVFKALRDFHQRGARLMTTNYDELLEHYCGLHRVRRLIPEDVRKYERCSSNRVFHIHGSFQDPQDSGGGVRFHRLLSSEDFRRCSEPAQNLSCSQLLICNH
jgi:NAD-dependent SIR2 family protein deacetylase